MPWDPWRFVLTYPPPSFFNKGRGWVELHALFINRLPNLGRSKLCGLFLTMTIKSKVFVVWGYKARQMSNQRLAKKPSLAVASLLVVGAKWKVQQNTRSYHCLHHHCGPMTTHIKHWKSSDGNWQHKKEVKSNKSWSKACSIDLIESKSLIRSLAQPWCKPNMS